LLIDTVRFVVYRKSTFNAALVRMIYCYCYCVLYCFGDEKRNVLIYLEITTCFLHMSIDIFALLLNHFKHKFIFRYCVFLYPGQNKGIVPLSFIQGRR
jgi:hypothetical protein